MTPRARIVRTSGAAAAEATPPSMRPSPAQWRRVAREEIEARLAADRIVEEARSRAEAIAIRARDDARSEAARGAREAEEQAEAKIAARWLALRQAEGERLKRDSERVIAVGVVLAERLLGTALELAPALIADLARTAIAEARGARRIAVEAHPLDASALRRHLGVAGLDTQSVEVREDEALARGQLRLQTDVGIIDAKLAPRLERLAAALRDALP
ncbi:MAG TPA: FliH/SctL family protein [Polyangiaceae bacterium]|nr:FliH/SctL family protein [Polyangiaceae bacterium]